MEGGGGSSAVLLTRLYNPNLCVLGWLLLVWYKGSFKQLLKRGDIAAHQINLSIGQNQSCVVGLEKNILLSVYMVAW